MLIAPSLHYHCMGGNNYDKFRRHTGDFVCRSCEKNIFHVTFSIVYNRTVHFLKVVVARKFLPENLHHIILKR